MAIFGIGASYGDTDMAQNFINDGVVGVGWDETDAPEIKQFLSTLKVGDIVYIKSYPPNSKDFVIKGIGFVEKSKLEDDNSRFSESKFSFARYVRWIIKKEISIPKPKEKNNVRLNTMYEEFHPEIQKIILDCIIDRF